MANSGWRTGAERVTAVERVEDLLPTTTDSPEATQALGARLAERLRPGDVVALYGDLGAGKTQLAKGIGAALGLDAHVITSPTFTLLHEYDGGECFPLYHFDAYRLDGPDAFAALGFEDYFDAGGVCLIEWPARVEALLPERTLRLHLAHDGLERRRVFLRGGEEGIGERESG